MPTSVLALASRKSMPWPRAQSSASSRETTAGLSTLFPTSSFTTSRAPPGQYTCE